MVAVRLVDAAAREIVLLPEQAREDAALARLHLAAEPMDVAFASDREFVDDASQSALDGRPLGFARRGELCLVLPQAVLNAPTLSRYIGAELLHIGGARIVSSRGGGLENNNENARSKD
jgi:hypothetical protein